MITFIEGKMEEKGADRVVLHVGGMGYEVLVPTQTVARLPAPGEVARLFTRMQVRDEAMVLFGFSTQEERGLFDHLITVSGVGPKVALAILSALTPDALRRAVAAGDAAALALAPGVGKKVASRVIVDLRDRIGAGPDLGASGPVAEVREALLSLGLSPQEAHDALAAVAPDGERAVEDLLREALRSAGR